MQVWWALTGESSFVISAHPMIMACRMASTCTGVLLAAAAVLTAALICLPFPAAGSVVQDGECSADGLEDCHSKGSELHTGMSVLLIYQGSLALDFTITVLGILLCRACMHVYIGNY